MNVTPPTSFSLETGPLRCDLRPDLGGAIAGLWLQGTPVLRSTPAAELTDVRQAGCFPLVPFSNRVGHARLHWQGQTHLLRPDAHGPHAIHGVGRQRPWQVTEQQPTRLVMVYRHTPDADWPFAFEATQSVALESPQAERGVATHAPDARVTITLAIRNLSDQVAPAGLGLHPYFVKRTRSRIAFEATARWEMGDDMLPTHSHAAHGIDANCAFLDVDNCFEGWPGVVDLRDELMRVRTRSSVSRLVVYTREALPFIALEPVSHVNNAFSLHTPARTAQSLGIRALEPGQSFSTTTTWDIDRV